MRILIVLHQFYPEFSGGTERVGLNLAQAAQRAGHFVRILACSVHGSADGVSFESTLTHANDMVFGRIPVTLLPRNLMPASADFSLDVATELVEPIANWMRSERFDIVHVMHSMRMSTAILAAQHAGIPYVMTMTDFFPACSRINLVNLDNAVCSGPQEGSRCARDCLTAPWSENALMNRHTTGLSILKGASARLVPSEYVAARYRSAFPTVDFQVIAHGVDMLALLAGTSRSPRRAVESATLTLGYIGSIIPQKGLMMLLTAMSLVPDLPIKLLVAGGFYGAASFKSEVLSLSGQDRRIEFLGQIEATKVCQVIERLDLLCLPSQVPETFSLVLHEACALGVPALVSDLGAPASHVSHFGGGKVLPAKLAQAWADAIAEVYSHPDLLEKWGSELPLPLRVEEEAFFYDSLYRAAAAPLPLPTAGTA